MGAPRAELWGDGRPGGIGPGSPHANREDSFHRRAGWDAQSRQAPEFSITPTCKQMSKVQKKARTIVDIATSDDNFTTLVGALQAAGLVDTLKGNGPFTVFAPTNAAFDRLPKQTLEDLMLPKNKSRLQEVLKHHVVSGRRMAKEVSRQSSLSPMSGDAVPVRAKGTRVRIGDATIQQTDLEAENGIVHVIDRVLLS